MEPESITKALSALAQKTRLKVFRLLLEHGEKGMPATVIAEKLGIKQNLMSAHLSVLANAGLTTTRREGRNIFHAINHNQAEALVSFFVCDCFGADQSTLQQITGQALADSNAKVQELRVPAAPKLRSIAVS